MSLNTAHWIVLFASQTVPCGFGCRFSYPPYLRYAEYSGWSKVSIELSKILEAYLENEVALKRYLRRFIRSREAADDLAQETFLRAFAAESARMIEAPKAFLFKVAKNLALNELARQSSMAIEPLGDFEGQEVLEDNSQAAVDDVVESRERMRLLARAIAALPPQCAKVFILRKMRGMSQKEIAVRLDISVRTVENHVALGLSRCRAYMRAHGGAVGEGSGNSRMPEQIPTAFVKAKKAE
ncbi:MAG TPA: RNA polymerase sigma factor [Rhizomicrobium sp.]|nr:RNA polymerase sigma factor [Rhizomicrobium sp.]